MNLLLIATYGAYICMIGLIYETLRGLDQLKTKPADQLHFIQGTKQPEHGIMATIKIVLVAILLFGVISMGFVWLSAWMLSNAILEQNCNDYASAVKHEAFNMMAGASQMQGIDTCPWTLFLNESKHVLINADHLSMRSYVMSEPEMLGTSWYKKLPTWWPSLPLYKRKDKNTIRGAELCPDPLLIEKRRMRSIKKMRMIDDYEMQEMIGAGGFGSVRLAFLKGDPRKKYVIKRVLKRKIMSHRWMQLVGEKTGIAPAISLPIEASILLYIRSLPPSAGQQLVIRLEEYLEDTSYYYLVFEWLPNAMDITHFFSVQRQRQISALLSLHDMRRLFYLTAKAVAFLHDNHIVHGDIKDENVLLYGYQNSLPRRKLGSRKKKHPMGLRVKLIDFGSCAYVSKESPWIYEYRGGSKYKSPEILQGQMPFDGFKQDVWSLGILFYFMLYGTFPEDPMRRSISLPRHHLMTPGK